MYYVYSNKLTIFSLLGGWTCINLQFNPLITEKVEPLKTLIDPLHHINIVN